MRKRLFISLLFSLILFSVSAQESIPGISTVSRLTFLNPGFSFETGTGKYQSIHAHVFIAPATSLSYSSSLGFDSDFSLDPGFTLDYRFYYNGLKRQAKGKRTALNSMNYVSPTFGIFYPKTEVVGLYDIEKYRHPITELGIVWGLQRNYAGRFSLDLNLGLGYLFNRERDYSTGSRTYINTSDFTTIIRLRLGCWLGKKIVEKQ